MQYALTLIIISFIALAIKAYGNKLSPAAEAFTQPAAWTDPNQNSV